MTFLTLFVGGFSGGNPHEQPGGFVARKSKKVKSESDEKRLKVLAGEPLVRDISAGGPSMAGMDGVLKDRDPDHDVETCDCLRPDGTLAPPADETVILAPAEPTEIQSFLVPCELNGTVIAPVPLEDIVDIRRYNESMIEVLAWVV